MLPPIVKSLDFAKTNLLKKKYMNGYFVGFEGEVYNGYFCFSICVDKSDTEFKGEAYCCQTNDCNVPKNFIVTTTTTSTKVSSSSAFCVNKLLFVICNVLVQFVLVKF